MTIDHKGQGHGTSDDLQEKLKDSNSADGEGVCDNLEQCQKCIEGQDEPIEGQDFDPTEGFPDFGAHCGPFFRGRGAFLRGMFRGRGHWGQSHWFPGQANVERSTENSANNLDLDKDIKMEDNQNINEGQGQSHDEKDQNESQDNSSQDPNFFFPPNFGRFMHGRGHIMRGMLGRGMFHPAAGRGSEFWKSPRGMMLRGMMGRFHRGGRGRGEALQDKLLIDLFCLPKNKK